jgi:hypothetical protein
MISYYGTRVGQGLLEIFLHKTHTYQNRHVEVEKMYLKLLSIGMSYLRINLVSEGAQQVLSGKVNCGSYRSNIRRT